MIREELGVLLWLDWAFSLPTLELWGVRIPLLYGIGLFPLVMMFTLALVIEGRFVNILRQYHSVKIGYPFLAVAIGAGMVLVDVLPEVSDPWYSGEFSVWYHYGLIAVGVLMAFKLKWAKIKETRTKRLIWIHARPQDEITTAWLNTDHASQDLYSFLELNNRNDVYGNGLVRKLKFGVAYTWRQHLSATALGHLVAMVGMTYLVGVVIPVACTKFAVHIDGIAHPAGYALGLVLMIVTFGLWLYTTRLDNYYTRPDLSKVHPDEWPWPVRLIGAIVRWVKSLRSSPHDEQLGHYAGHPDDPTGSQGHGGASLVDELLDHGPEADAEGRLARPSFGQRYVEPFTLDGPKGGSPYSSQSVLAPVGTYGVDGSLRGDDRPEVAQESVWVPHPPTVTERTVEEPASGVLAAQEPEAIVPRILDSDESQAVRREAIDAVDPLKQRAQGVGDVKPPAPEQPAQRAQGLRLGPPTPLAPAADLEGRGGTPDSGNRRAPGLRLSGSGDAGSERRRQSPPKTEPADSGAVRAPGLRLGDPVPPATAADQVPSTPEPGNRRAPGLRLSDS